ncbi:hypothetical protein PGT21_001705 [Puccinia graminis f. sp. tritici]|uniref:Uncharacterized protein n=1 Tax=Puccinia graminis f. sp. tritici TaxID=56615 RepID=A0A5B0SHR0_PUCGR|nr:hypothetical protein PGTUg99_008659 [Puccinia graminis f. sp. tritici]KAA1071264.1 hypothetical protein PGT21_001705 [Puccinia graminis f. sp. tritici]KAA1137471.1 hypothetical protein PGTUg99_018049 [Puccinia graminis f. sp. tritici]
MRFTDTVPLLLVLLLTIASYIAQRSSGPNGVGDDPDMDMEGMLIDDGPNNATNSPASAYPSLTFTSALELQPPHPISTVTTSPVTIPPATPSSTSIPRSNSTNGTSPSLTSSGTSQVVATQTGLPPVPRTSGAGKLDRSFYELIGLVICLGSLWGID